ncbi:hypothetical protein ABZ948_22175, partial [Streptomyces olindensis]
KAGAVAKALSVAGKAGRVIDPMTYIAKGAGAGLSKIGDITKGLKGVGNIDIPALPENAVTLPEGTVRLPDGTVHLPEGAAIPDGATKLPDGNVRLPDDAPVLPEGTTKLPTEDGAPARYYDPDGNILDEHGNVLQKSADGPGDVVDQPHMPDTDPPASGADTPRVDSPAQQPALVGAGTHTAEQAGQHIRLGDGLDNNLGDVGRVGEDVPTAPAVHAGGDVPTAVHAGGDLPGSGVGDHLLGGSADHMPGGTAHEHGAGPSASHEPPSGHGGDHGIGSHTESSGSSTHEASAGGHEQPSTGGHADRPVTGGHEGPAPGGGDGPIGSDAGHGPGISGMDEPAGWERPAEPTGPLERGGELEQQVRDQIRGTKVKSGDVDAIIKTLSGDPAGKEIAETIASGRFRRADGFSDVVSNLTRPSDLPGALEQIRLGNRLHEHGITDISFEVKQGGHEIKPGVVTGPKTDMDVMARDAEGRAYAWQFKDMTGSESTSDASRVVSKIYQKLHQLTDSHADVKTFVVDTKASLADMQGQIKRLQQGFEGKGVQFVIRTPDGNVFVPPGGTFMPEEVL